MERPTISADNAVTQAGTTLGQYISQAITEIDKRLGEGYAAKNPTLLAECVRSQILDFNSTALNSTLYDLRDALEGMRPM